MAPFGRLKESPTLRNFALDMGLLPGHSDYARFIILGRSRSGSNLLRGLLNAHPQVMAFGEIFQNKDEISWGLSGYPQNRKLQEQFLHEPVALLQEQVFRKQSKDVRAVGFKIFYYHAQDDDWRPVWDFLQNERSLQVIHIKRINMLRTHLSRKLALETDRWVNVTGERQTFQPIMLDYAECLADFEQTQSWQDESDRIFADHPLCHISYEGLSADIDAEMARVQEFLGVDLLPVTPETHQQNTQALSDSIANYEELKRQFAGTRWRVFFEE